MSRTRYIADPFWVPSIPFTPKERFIRENLDNPNLEQILTNRFYTKPPPKCGSRSKYSYGCRCLECTNANNEYKRAHHANKK